MFMGFTGQSWNVDREASLFPGQTYTADDYTLSYVGARMEVDNSKRMVFADVDVYKNGKFEERLSPGKFIYKKQPDSPTTEVAIGHGLRDDVYLIVGSINPGNKNLAAFQLHINPLVSWIWIGCIVLIAGSVVCMWPQLEFGESRVWAGARGVAATAASVVFGIMLAATPAAQAQTMSGAHGDGAHRERHRAIHLRFAALHVRHLRARPAVDLHVRDRRRGARQDPGQAPRGRGARPDHRRVCGRLRSRGARRPAQSRGLPGHLGGARGGDRARARSGSPG